MESISQDRMSASGAHGNQNQSQSYEGEDGQKHMSKRKGVSERDLIHENDRTIHLFVMN